MRILIAGFNQETNSFSPSISTLSFFNSGSVCEGDDFLKSARSSHGAVSGFLDAVMPYDAAVVFGMRMQAPSSGGPVDHDVVEMFLQNTRKRIIEVEPDVILRILVSVFTLSPGLMRSGE